MKTLQKISIVIAAILIMNIQLEAQEGKIDFDGLKIGKSYRVSIQNGWNTEGKLSKIDSDFIEIETEYKTFTIKESEIGQIVEASSDFEDYNTLDPTDIKYKDKVKSDKLYLSVGTGINFMTTDYSQNYSPGINIQLNIMKILSPSYAIRGDFQFAQNPAKVRGYKYNFEGGEYSSKYEGGNLNNYSFKFDFLIGGFKTSSKLNGYGIIGTGLTFANVGESKYEYSYPEYNYITNTYTSQTYSYTYKGATRNEMILEFGGGLGYKISDKLRIYGEAQYSFPFIYFGKYGGFSFESFSYGNPSLKIGAQIEL